MVSSSVRPHWRSLHRNFDLISNDLSPAALEAEVAKAFCAAMRGRAVEVQHNGTLTRTAPGGMAAIRMAALQGLPLAVDADVDDATGADEPVLTLVSTPWRASSGNTGWRRLRPTGSN